MEEIFDQFEVTVISEMAGGTSTLVPLTKQEVEEIAGDDPDPKFATYIIDGGWSKSRRYYGPQVLDAICEQINNAVDPVVGYKGHIPPEQDSYAFPDIQFRWAKAKIQATSEKSKLLVKAYLLPGTKAREYAERGLKVPISIRANADQRPTRGGVEVLANGFDLESIDMARPRKAGMGGRQLALTSEMEGGSTEVDGKEIAALKESDLREHNPLLVKEIEENAKKPLSEKVTEMESNQENAQENADLISKLRKALGINDDADILEVVGTTLKELKANATKAREAVLDGILEKRFKDESSRKLVRRILATEMESAEFPTDVSDEAEKVKLTEMVNKVIDEDDDLKGLVSEMGDGGGSNLGNEGERQDRNGNGQREIKPGFSNSNITARKARV